MNKGMTVTYEVDRGLYVNITNRCTNRCDFCIRNNGDGAYGSDSLWLSREPSTEEIIEDVLKRDVDSYDEIVFCGYGEPSVRLHDAINVVRAVRVEYPNVKIRINTNGHSDLIFGTDTASLYEGVFDTVSISLNAPNPERYDEICHPVYKNDTFDAILQFAQNVKKYVQNVRFTVVSDFVTEREIEECQRIAASLSIPLSVRAYISE